MVNLAGLWISKKKSYGVGGLTDLERAAFKGIENKRGPGPGCLCEARLGAVFVLFFGWDGQIRGWIGWIGWMDE